MSPEESDEMLVGVLKETYPGERRVALVPGEAANLKRAGLGLLIEPDAGAEAGFPDGSYVEKGARMAGSRAEVFREAELLLQVRTYGANLEAGKRDLPLHRAGQAVVGFSEPLTECSAAQELAHTGAMHFSMELIPRISRAQSMDALSSMATVAGYKSVLLAAERLPKMFPMMMTAAGTILPARVLVVGAGVAGLQAIATSRRLGAVVKAYDIRPAVREQVESLGAKFLNVELERGTVEDKGGYAVDMGEEFYRRQRELLTAYIARQDVVITTAAVPGKKAPMLVTREMVGGMNPGSVVMDLAIERGGNCELSSADKIVRENGVTILAPSNLPASVPYHASQMYAKNISAFVQHLVKEGRLQPDTSDEIIRETLVTREGKVVHPRVLQALNPDLATALS